MGYIAEGGLVDHTYALGLVGYTGEDVLARAILLKVRYTIKGGLHCIKWASGLYY